MTTFEPGASDVLTHGLLVSPRATALRASSPAASMTDGFEVFVQLVIAAITTWPLSSARLDPVDDDRHAVVDVAGLARGGDRLGVVGVVACSGGRMPARSVTSAGRRPGTTARRTRSCRRARPRRRRRRMRREIPQRDPEGGLGLAQRDAVLRPARARERRHDLAEVERDRVGVDRLRGALVVPQALLARVRLDELDQLGRAAGELAGSGSSRRRSGRSRRSRRTPGSCCRSSRGRRAAARRGPGRRTRRTCRRRRARAASP